MTMNLPQRILPETDLWTPRECAAYRRRSVRHLDRERADGSEPPYIRDGSRILYRHADVDAWLDNHVRGVKAGTREAT